MRTPGSGVLALGFLLVAGQLAFRGWGLFGGWFYFDDLAFMSRAMNQPFDADYLLESYGGHLMPAGFAVVWALTEAAVFTWWPWAVVLLLMQALAGVGMLRLLASMFGRKPIILVLLAGYLFYVFTLPAGVWWAAGINQLPMQIALVFGLHAHLNHLRNGRARPLVAALLWTTFGLLFYEKTLLLLGIYALVTVCWFSQGQTPERLRAVWARYRVAVVSYVVLGVAYLIFYVQFGLEFSPTAATGQDWSPLAGNLVGVAGSTALIGGPFSWQPISVGSFANPSQLVMLASWVAVGALVFHAHRTRTLSRRAWAPLGFALVCNVVLLASARANIVGPDIGREYRYQTESGALFVLGAGLAFLPLIGAKEVNEVRADAVRTYERPRIIAVGAAAVVIAALVSSVRYVDLWHDNNPTRDFFAEVESSLDEAPQQPVPLADVGLPQTLLWSYRYPENSYSHILRHRSAITSYPSASVDSLFMFSDQGALRPVVVPPTRSMVAGDGCGYRLDSETQIPLDGPVIGGGWWVQMGYASPDEVEVTVTAGIETHDLVLPAGLHNVYFQAAGEFSEITVTTDAPRRRSPCVTGLDLGLPQPADSPT